MKLKALVTIVMLLVSANATSHGGGTNANGCYTKQEHEC